MGNAPQMVWHKQADFDAVDLIVLPGGFSYGDYLRAGAMSAKSPVMKEVVARAHKGVPVLGICNGFQILTEAGLLPGALMRNAELKFVCHDVKLKVENTQTLFTTHFGARDTVTFPVAHHDGNYFADRQTLADIEHNGQVAFRYVDDGGMPTESANPNGSQHNIAGLFNARKTVLGMMPHPERLIDEKLGGSDGGILFDGLVAALS